MKSQILKFKKTKILIVPKQLMQKTKTILIFFGLTGIIRKFVFEHK